MALSASATRMVKILVGFILVWIVLDRSAVLLRSYRGEAGIIVCILVLAVAVTVEWLLFGLKPVEALRALGFRAATRGSMIASLALSALLLCYFPLYAAVAGVPLGVRSDWYLAAAWIARAGRHCGRDAVPRLSFQAHPGRPELLARSLAGGDPFCRGPPAPFRDARSCRRRRLACSLGLDILSAGVAFRACRRLSLAAGDPAFRHPGCDQAGRGA